MLEEGWYMNEIVRRGVVMAALGTALSVGLATSAWVEDTASDFESLVQAAVDTARESGKSFHIGAQPAPPSTGSCSKGSVRITLKGTGVVSGIGRVSDMGLFDRYHGVVVVKGIVPVSGDCVLGDASVEGSMEFTGGVFARDSARGQGTVAGTVKLRYTDGTPAGEAVVFGTAYVSGNIRSQSRVEMSGTAKVRGEVMLPKRQ